MGEARNGMACERRAAMRRDALLASLTLFAGVPDEAVAAVADASTVRAVARGDALVRAGEDSDKVFVVVSGRFEVSVLDRGDRSEIGPGELVGEIGFFARIARTATVTAIRDAVVLELDRAAFDRVAAAHPVLLQAALVAVSAGSPTRPGRPARARAPG